MKSCLQVLIFEDFLLRIQSLVKRLERIISSKYPKMVLWCWLAWIAEHIWYEHGWMCGAEQSSHTSSFHIGSGSLVSWRAVPAEESEGLGGERERLEDGSMVQDTAWRERDSWAAPRSVTACLPVGPQALSILYQDIWHNRVTRRPRAKQWGKKPLTRSLTALKKVKVWNKTTKTKSSILRAKYHFVFTGGGVSRESWAQGLLVDYHNITSEAASFLPVFMRAEPRPVQQGQRCVNL